MRFRASAIIFIVFFSLILPATAAVAPSIGKSCSPEWKVVTVKKQKLTCMKVGTKLIWVKGELKKPTSNASPSPTPFPTQTPTVAPTPSTSPIATPSTSPEPTPTPTPIPTPTPTLDEATFVFDDICQPDPFIPTQWAGMEERVNARGQECSWPYRIVKKILPSTKPTTLLNEKVQSAEICKLRNHPLKGASNAWQADHIDFWYKYMRYPSMNTVISLIPIYSKDAPDNGKDPAQDYKPYLDFLREWIDHASDGSAKVTIKSPSRYIEFPEKIADYNLSHVRPQQVADNFVAAIDKYITPKMDLTGVNIGLVVLPAGSKFSLMQEVGLGQIRIGNDFVRIGTEPPFTLTDNLGNGSNFIHPAWWVHEINHYTVGFDDNNSDSPDGLYWWGTMSYGANEMLGWQKWITGFWEDQRINCVDTESGGTYWIAPSTYQTQMKKLIVVPASSSKVIVIESMRAGGLDYKMPKWMEGTLVYVIDNTATEQDTGSFVLKPAERKLLNPTWKGLTRTFVNSDAALKLGESTTYLNWKITIVESGAFGDVVKVEKI